VESLAIVGALAGCPSPQAVSCGDGRYCPAFSQCSNDDICLADQRQCSRFADRTPCASDVFGRGHCFDDSCLPGVRVLGRVGAAPMAAPLPGARISVLDHPEVAPAFAVDGGVFELAGVPRTSSVALEVSATGQWDSITRFLETDVTSFLFDNEPNSDGLIPLVSDEALAAIGTVIGVTFDPARGLVSGMVWLESSGLPLAGAVPTIAGATCEGVVYFGADGTPSTAGGTDAGGDGVFAMFNCEPVELAEVTITHPAWTDCSVTFPDLTPSLHGTVRARTMSWLGHVWCR
jgi:hypothetical protein